MGYSCFSVVSDLSAAGYKGAISAQGLVGDQSLGLGVIKSLRV